MATNGLNKTLQVSPELSKIINKSKASRAQCMKLIWAYIKKYELQDPYDKRTIIPDSKLSDVLGSRPISMFKIAGKLSEHLK